MNSAWNYVYNYSEAMMVIHVLLASSEVYYKLATDCISNTHVHVPTSCSCGVVCIGQASE